MKIGSINVRGMRDRLKRLAVFRYAKQNRFSIMLLQETYITKEDIEKWQGEWGGKLYAVPFTNRSRGMVMLFNTDLDISNAQEIDLNDIRMQLIKFRVDGDSFALMNIYAPNSDTEKIRFYTDLVATMQANVDVEQSYVVVGGDMNTLCDAQLDNIAGEAPDRKVVQTFNDFIDSCNLTDVWRQANIGKKQFTWKRQHPYIARRLDYLLCNDIATGKCLDTQIVPFAKSDHDVVLVEIEPCPYSKGPGYWKMNNNLLKDPAYVEMINEILSKVVADCRNIVNPQVLWDYCKAQVKAASITYGKRKAIESRTELSIIECKLKRLRENLLLNASDKLKEQYDKLESQFDKLTEMEAKGAQVRAKVQWIEKGENNTRFFLTLERAKQLKKSILKLKGDTDNEYFTQLDDIMFKLSEYYRHLYEKKIQFKPESLDQYLEGTELPSLNDELSLMCEGELTEAECAAVLRKMNNDSSPGIDGLGPGFYKVFWTRISLLVNESL